MPPPHYKESKSKQQITLHFSSTYAMRTFFLLLLLLPAIHSAHFLPLSLAMAVFFFVCPCLISSSIIVVLLSLPPSLHTGLQFAHRGRAVGSSIHSSIHVSICAPFFRHLFVHSALACICNVFDCASSIAAAARIALHSPLVCSTHINNNKMEEKAAFCGQN